MLLDDKFGAQKLGNTKGTGYFCNFDWITVYKPCISQYKKQRYQKKTSGATLQGLQGGLQPTARTISKDRGVWDKISL